MTTRPMVLFVLLMQGFVPAGAQDQKNSSPVSAAPAAQTQTERIPTVEEDNAPAGPVKPPPPEYRHHYALRHSVDGAPYYRVTVIVRFGNETFQELMLVDDAEHGSFVLEHLISFPNDMVSYTIWDSRLKEFARTSFDMPFQSKTWEGAKEELRNQSARDGTALVTIQTNAGEWRTSDAEWKDWPRMRELRRSVRQTVPFHLLEAVERMRGTIFTTSTGSAFYDAIGRYLIYQPTDRTPPELEEVTMAPDCDFDKSFGHPCSTAQQKRIAAAAEAGTILPRY